MKVRALAIVAVALAGAVGATFAEARDNGNVQFSVAIGQPVLGAWAQPVHDVGVYRPYGGWDRDHDGIPNRYDRTYNPRWDRDGDGIPNRYDRAYNPRGDRDRDGIPNYRDRVYDPRGDRDHDGIPNYWDRNDNSRWNQRPHPGYQPRWDHRY